MVMMPIKVPYTFCSRLRGEERALKASDYQFSVPERPIPYIRQSDQASAAIMHGRSRSPLPDRVEHVRSRSLAPTFTPETCSL